jgi:hypothetical protein
MTQGSYGTRLIWKCTFTVASPSDVNSSVLVFQYATGGTAAAAAALVQRCAAQIVEITFFTEKPSCGQASYRGQRIKPDMALVDDAGIRIRNLPNSIENRMNIFAMFGTEIMTLADGFIFSLIWQAVIPLPPVTRAFNPLRSPTAYRFNFCLSFFSRSYCTSIVQTVPNTEPNTEATAEIAEILLLDAAHLLQEDAEFKKKRHKKEKRKGPFPEIPLRNSTTWGIPSMLSTSMPLTHSRLRDILPGKYDTLETEPLCLERNGEGPADRLYLSIEGNLLTRYI